VKVVTVGAVARWVAGGEGGLSIACEEFALLDDGRRVQTDERDGHASVDLMSSAIAVPAGAEVPDELPSLGLTLAEVEEEAREITLGWPEDGEPSEHRFGRLLSALRREGLDVPLEDLDAAPFAVEIDPRLRELLA
jgi:hypothetical protein